MASNDEYQQQQFFDLIPSKRDFVQETMADILNNAVDLQIALEEAQNITFMKLEKFNNN